LNPSALITFRLPLLCTLLLSTLCLTHECVADDSDESVQQSHVSVSLGADYLEDTSVPDQGLTQMTIPLVITRENEDYAFEITLPYLQRTAPSGKLAIGHHQESRNDSDTTVAQRVTNKGLGDISTSLQRTLLNEKSAILSLCLKGEIKLGTADATQGLGSGMNDYFVEMKAKKTLDDFTGGASIGYAKLGSPGQIEINGIKKSIYFRNI
jgi:hypothetical protein